MKANAAGKMSKGSEAIEAFTTTSSMHNQQLLLTASPLVCIGSKHPRVYWLQMTTRYMVVGKYGLLVQKRGLKDH